MYVYHDMKILYHITIQSFLSRYTIYIIYCTSLTVSGIENLCSNKHRVKYRVKFWRRKVLMDLADLSAIAKISHPNFVHFPDLMVLFKFVKIKQINDILHGI